MLLALMYLIFWVQNPFLYSCELSSENGKCWIQIAHFSFLAQKFQGNERFYFKEKLIGTWNYFRLILITFQKDRAKSIYLYSKANIENFRLAFPAKYCCKYLLLRIIWELYNYSISYVIATQSFYRKCNRNSKRKR